MKSFLNSKTGIILCLISLPPIGLWLIWKRKTKLWKKIIAIPFAGLSFFIVIGSIGRLTMSKDEILAMNTEHLQKELEEKQEKIRIQKEDSLYRLSPQYKIDQKKKNKAELLAEIKKKWDWYETGGYFFELNYKLEKSMNDPSSFEHIKTTVFWYDEKEVCVHVLVQFRAKNGFGALMKTSRKYKLFADGRISLLD